jgi:hypothetical protein
MKHSEKKDDFFSQYQHMLTDDIYKGRGHSKEQKRLDIGTEFEEFLQSRHTKPNQQCPSG